MQKYGLHGKLQAAKGKGKALADILLQASALVMKGDGCHLYLVSRDAQDTDAIWITEVWDDKQAHDASLKQENVRALITKALPLLDGAPEKGQELEVLGGLPG